MALPDERCAQGRDGMQLSEIGQVLVEDWEIDIKQMIRRGRNAVIKCTVEIDHRIDAVAIHNPPVGNCWRDEKKSRVVHLNQFHSITVLGPKPGSSRRQPGCRLSAVVARGADLAGLARRGEGTGEDGTVTESRPF